MKKIMLIMLMLFGVIAIAGEKEKTVSKTYQDKKGIHFVFEENKNEWASEKVLILSGEAMIEEEASEDERRKNLSVSLILGDDVVSYYFVIKDGKVVKYWEESVPVDEYDPDDKFKE